MTRAAQRRLAIIGAGPAGLMAAETGAARGMEVHVFDAMPSVGRKFLMAGKGGMNITHAEGLNDFISRYGQHSPMLEALLRQFGPDQIRAWIRDLGIDTFVGTSGRVFPKEMKAAPLLRAWLHRLRGQQVRFHTRHRWLGWQRDSLLDVDFETPGGSVHFKADTLVLALGGGSWAKLGSDGAWVPWLRARNIPVASLQPSNCGFNVRWSEHFCTRYAGQPLKNIRAMLNLEDAPRSGEAMITGTGIEGGLIYALSAPLRDRIATLGPSPLYLDLCPGKSATQLVQDLEHPRGRDSLANHLRRRAGLEGLKAGLLREVVGKQLPERPDELAKLIKALPLQIDSPRPLDEAISSAGGVAWQALDETLMLRDHPQVYCVGEMLDWEAPTGGYLLTACLTTGRAWGGNR